MNTIQQHLEALRISSFEFSQQVSILRVPNSPVSEYQPFDLQSFEDTRYVGVYNSGKLTVFDRLSRKCTDFYERISIFTSKKVLCQLQFEDSFFTKKRKLVQNTNQKSKKRQRRKSRRRHSDKKSKLVCPICQDSDCQTELIKTPCRHHFHDDCLAQWFTKSKTCPVCREYYGATVGSQPPGTAICELIRDGCTYQISFFFANGKQFGKYHPHPGQSYDGDYRVIYLRATDEDSYEIMQAVLLCFKRRILFRLGQSQTRPNIPGKDLICWGLVIPVWTDEYTNPSKRYTHELREVLQSHHLLK